MSDEIPYGYCHCGCGQKTSISTFNDSRNGYKKGEPKRFINHHQVKKERKSKICVICGKVFIPAKANRQMTQLTCSGKCRNAYTSIKTSQKRSEKLKGRGEGKTYPKHMGRHEHRAVMEEIIGRPLLPDEVVHHKDGNKNNNSPENLELMKRTEHSSIHTKIRWKRIKGVENVAIFNRSKTCN